MIMQHKLSSTALLTALICAGAPLQAHAQLAAGCPKAGTVTKGTSSLFGPGSTTWTGTDPNDPAVCLGTTVNSNALITGKLRRQIYGWYDLTTWKWLEGEDQAKAGLRDLLSGKKDAVTISYTLSMQGQSWVSSTTDNWKRTGKTTLTIEGRAVEVITLQNDAVGTANNRYASHFDVWYDPANHVFVKVHQVASGGGAKSNDSETTSVLVP